MTPDLDRLEALEREATGRSSSKWVASPRNDGTASVYSPSLGPCREVVPIAETLADDAVFIAATRNALPALLERARSAEGLRARLEEAEHMLFSDECHCNGCGSITCVCWQCKAKDAYRAKWEGAPNVIGKRGAAERGEGEK